MYELEYGEGTEHQVKTTTTITVGNMLPGYGLHPTICRGPGNIQGICLLFLLKLGWTVLRSWKGNRETVGGQSQEIYYCFTEDFFIYIGKA